MTTKFIRKKNRLPYPQIYKFNNSFFVTVCVEKRKCIFVEEGLPLHINHNKGDIKSPLQLNFVGKIIEDIWSDLPSLFTNIVLDEYVLMPNHFHGIITFLNTPIRKSNKKEADLSRVISTFKSISWHQINKAFVAEPLRFQKEYELLTYQNDQNGNDKHFPTTKSFPSFWQKSFYDHVIRNEADFQRIQEYVYNNPLQWEIDLFNPTNNAKYQIWLQTEKSQSKPKKLK